MKKIGILLFVVVFVSVAFLWAEKDDDYTSSYSSYDSDNYSSHYSYSGSYTSSKSISNYCDATGCLKEGTKSYCGITGQTEYYCYTHYNEMMGMLGDMEDDVADSAYSKHTCEECSREGTYSITGLSGLTEYYCSIHYYELKDLLDSLY